MSIKRILAAAAASVVAVSAMAVVASADAAFTGSHTMKDAAWWTQDLIAGGEEELPISNLIGDVDPATVTSITFTSDTTFVVGYNDSNGDWFQTDANNAQTSYTFDNILLTDLDEEHKPGIFLAISKGDSVEYTINWTVETGDAAPADPEPAPADPEPAPADPEPSPAPANNVDTGVEGVAAVLGVAAVAAGAMIVAKKRK